MRGGVWERERGGEKREAGRKVDNLQYFKSYPRGDVEVQS